MKFLIQSALITLALFIAGIAFTFANAFPNPTGKEKGVFWALLLIAAITIVLVIKIEKEEIP